MKKYRTFLVIAERARAEGTPARETSWRDLLRRLAKKLAKHPVKA